MRRYREVKPNMGFLAQLGVLDDKLRKDRYRSFYWRKNKIICTFAQKKIAHHTRLKKGIYLLQDLSVIWLKVKVLMCESADTLSCMHDGPPTSVVKRSPFSPTVHQSKAKGQKRRGGENQRAERACLVACLCRPPRTCVQSNALLLSFHAYPPLYLLLILMGRNSTLYHLHLQYTLSTSAEKKACAQDFSSSFSSSCVKRGSKTLNFSLCQHSHQTTVPTNQPKEIFALKRGRGPQTTFFQVRPITHKGGGKTAIFRPLASSPQLTRPCHVWYGTNHANVRGWQARHFSIWLFKELANKKYSICLN